MSDGEPLDLERVMGLVADAMEAVYLGYPLDRAARLIASTARDRRELAAARNENLQVHGGGYPPEISDEVRKAMGPAPAPPEFLRLRQAIDEVLAEAERLVGP